MEPGIWFGDRALRLPPNIMDKKVKDFLDSIKDPDKRKRLEALQWRIDKELEQYKDPVARYNHMVTLFWEQVGKFQDALEGKLPNKYDNITKFKRR